MADRNYILGESLKPGGTARLFTKGAADLGGKIGNFFRGGSQSSGQTSTTPTKTVKQQQLQTYNSRYPGFDKEDYLRLEQLVDQKGVTGSKKAQLMDEAYQYYYPQVLNKHKLDERQNVINDWVYNNGEKLANGDQLTNAQYRLLNLTQMAKEKFDLAYNVEDGDIVRNIREKVPNGQELLRNFLSTGDPEILYATGIYDKGQKAQDFRSQKDIAQESLGGNYWKNIWNNMYANSFAPLDAFEKFTYKGLKNLQNLGLKLDDYLAGVAPQSWKDDIMGDMTLEEYRARNKEERETNKKEIDEYIKMVNDANQRNRSNTVNPIVDNYYSRRNFTDLLADGDLEGFFYKGLGDAATNWDMPVVIGASIINPAMGTALMGTNTYVRESEEAYEAMRKAGATHEQAEAGGATVGLLNTFVEIYLDRWLGGTESTTTKGVRDALKKNVLKEVSNKPIEDIIGNAATTYARSSMEEGLEEWVQNTITNAAKMTVEENPEWKDLFEGGRQAFEGGAFNPFNILSPAGDLYSNRESIKQSMMDGAYDAGVTVRNITDMFKGVPKDSGNVWQKVVETTTRNIPEKVVENELKLTPTERKNVERYGITPANFVLKENIAGLSNADKVVALQDISSDAYNNVTNIFKNVIPQDYRTESKTAGKMLKTMIDTMEKSDIVKEEYADYIAKLKEMLDYSDFSPYEKLAIRRDFDAIVGNDIFGANGRVKGLEDQTIAKWRADLNEEINQLGDEFGIDVKSENARIANAITIRDGLLRALSQNKKNNAIGLQDLGIGAILSAGNPVQAGGIIIAKRLLENAAGNIAQGLYNTNNTPLTPSNTKRGAGFIQRAGTNANNNFMISTTSSNNSINPQEELSSKTARYQVAEEVSPMEEWGIYGLEDENTLHFVEDIQKSLPKTSATNSLPAGYIASMIDNMKGSLKGWAAIDRLIDLINDASKKETENGKKYGKGLSSKEYEIWRNKLRERADAGFNQSQASSKTAKYQVADDSVPTQDNTGKKLSKGQQEYFKGSKVVDEDGNLLRVYHGTRSDYTVYQQGKGEGSNSLSSVGFRFTPTKEGALGWAEQNHRSDGKARAEEVYLDIKNPKIYEPSDIYLLEGEAKKEAINNQWNIYKKKEGEANNKDYTYRGGMFNDEFDHPYYERAIFENLQRSYETDKNYDGKLGKYDPEAYRALAEEFNRNYNANIDYDKVLEDFTEYVKLKEEAQREYEKYLDMEYSDPYEDFQYDIYKLDSNMNNRWTKKDLNMALNDYSSPRKFTEKLKSEGYDGIIIKQTNYDGNVFGGRNDQYVVFDSNQIKKIDNLNPTENEDIRFQKYGVADPNSKSITAQEGLNIKDFRNGRTVEDIANQYGIKVDIVEKILTPAGEKALGMYDKGIITLAKDLKESTVPHELLHAVFDMVDASKRKSILDGIQKRLDVDAVQAEEWLADSFSEYYRTGNINTTSMTSTLVGKIKQFFQMIKEFIDGTYANRKEIQRLFDDIIEGNSLAGDNSVMSELDERYQRGDEAQNLR